MASTSSLHRPPVDTRVVAWTGRELFLWGLMPPEYPDTAAYDPKTDRWRWLARSPLDGISTNDFTPLHVVIDDQVWIYAGSVKSGQPFFHVYDSKTDGWSMRVVEGSRHIEPTHLAWMPATRELVGFDDGLETLGFAYRIDDHTTRDLSFPNGARWNGIPDGRRLWTTRYDGVEIWDSASNTWRSRDVVMDELQYSRTYSWPGPTTPSILFVKKDMSGLHWSGDSDAFVPFAAPTEGVLPWSGWTNVVWTTERAVFFWGANDSSVRTGASYDIVSRRWRSMPPGGPHSPLVDAVWTGDVAILLGTDGEGARYRP